MTDGAAREGVCNVRVYISTTPGMNVGLILLLVDAPVC